MKFIQDLIIAIFLPRRARKPVRFKLTKAQQHQVLKGCSEINSLIQEVHGNLSDIRDAGVATTQLTQRTHQNNLKGRINLQEQKEECERINQQLKQISQDMRAVRENVALSSQKTFLAHNNLKTLERKVSNMSAAEPTPANVTSNVVCLATATEKD